LVEIVNCVTVFYILKSILSPILQSLPIQVKKNNYVFQNYLGCKSILTKIFCVIINIVFNYYQYLSIFE